MKTSPYQEALEAYANPFHQLEITPLKLGLINQSYKVTSKNSGESFLLQEINREVFADPVAIQDNYEKIWEHISTRNKYYSIPSPKYFPGDTNLYCDTRERYWRVFEYIEGTQSFNIARDLGQARQVAQTFASFTSCFSDFDLSKLTVVIPDFHDLAMRYSKFEEALLTPDRSRLHKAASLAIDIKNKVRYVHVFEVMTESPEFKKRIMHHDAKISNVLFNGDSGEVICPVDLDTVMPGLIFSDLGDMIRSMAGSSQENERYTDDIHIRKDYYKAILNGYLEIMGDQLTVSEKKYIHYAGLFITYMQAMRYLTDYLEGDRYFKTSYQHQNLDRALNQFALLKKLEAFVSSEYKFPFQS